ncbi:MAG: hypothetical protein IT510_08215 [Sulfuritalea sp.]|nr:hypothetical protein [Sulfuritalea sp.]
MPYYIYRVTPLGPVRQLARLSQFEVFKEASTEAKRLRREAGLAPGELIKTIFAENELQAEELLSQPAREDFADGEDY